MTIENMPGGGQRRDGSAAGPRLKIAAAEAGFPAALALGRRWAGLVPLRHDLAQG